MGRSESKGCKMASTGRKIPNTKEYRTERKRKKYARPLFLIHLFAFRFFHLPFLPLCKVCSPDFAARLSSASSELIISVSPDQNESENRYKNKIAS